MNYKYYTNPLKIVNFRFSHEFLTDNRVSRNKDVYFFDQGMQYRLREMLAEDEGVEPCVHFVPILDGDGNSYGIIGLDTLQRTGTNLPNYPIDYI